jgi:hypothetical protein
VIFGWKPGSVVHTDATVAGNEIERIAEKHGIVSPELVVNESRPVTAPLHGEFEWDDAKAASEYRVSQARYILRSITVKLERHEDEKPVRFVVNVVQQPKTEGAQPERGYVRVTDAMADPELRKQVLLTAWRELEAWRRKYEEYEELSALFESMDRLKERELVAV